MLDTGVIQIYVFVLAGFVGFLVITRVPPLLHTPLMAATNAISAISVVGALVAAGSDHNQVATILGFEGDLTPLYLRNQELHGVFLTREGARLRELARLVELGKLAPLVAQVLPLERASEAHRQLDSGHGRGKIVLQVA